MNSIYRQAAALLLVVGLFIALTGCGYESLVRDENPIPLSGDVIVIGYSFGGLVAALEAARQGAAVFVFYDTPLQDSWIWNGGALIAGQGDDEENDEEFSADGLRAALVNGGGKSADRQHCQLIARRSRADMDWLSRETGVEFVRDSGYHHLPSGLSCARVYERLVEAAELEGVRFIEGVSRIELIVKEESEVRNERNGEGNGEGAVVAGISFETTPDIQRFAYASAVILADGGYLGSADLLENLAPSVTPASWRDKQKGVALQVALDAGVDLVDEALFSYAPTVDNNNGYDRASWLPNTIMIVEDRIIPLDGKSEREMVAELLGAPDRTGLLLIAGAQLPRDYSLDWPKFSGIDEFMERHRLELPQLRQWYDRPHGEFFGLPVKIVAEYCLGGVAVNPEGIALSGGVTVTGLYAIGETAGGLYGRGLLQGAALTGDVVWGRVTGKAVAEYARR